MRLSALALALACAAFVAGCGHPPLSITATCRGHQGVQEVREVDDKDVIVCRDGYATLTRWVAP